MLASAMNPPIRVRVARNPDAVEPPTVNGMSRRAPRQFSATSASQDLSLAEF
jgi:hypothetical protein